MGKIEIISAEQKREGELIRYIKIDKNKYIISTLNEIDSENYEKLYINKFIENEEDLIDESEWSNLKALIPTIVKEIRSNSIQNFEDLEYNDICVVNEEYSRVFKLKTDIVNSIKKEEKTIVTEEKVEEKSKIELPPVEEQSEVKLPPIEEKPEIELPPIEEPSTTIDTNIDQIDSELNSLLSEITKQEEEINNLDTILEDVEKKEELDDRNEERIRELEEENAKLKEKLQKIRAMIEES